MNRVLVVFSDGLLSELDSARGLVSRSAWIRQAVEDKLMKEAAAPLVPMGGYLVTNDVADRLISEALAFDEAEQKPKARRKKSVKDSPAANRSEDRQGGLSFPAPAESPSLHPSVSWNPVRCHCKRGMIIGAGPRKGQCTVCGNPKPLKESNDG